MGEARSSLGGSDLLLAYQERDPEMLTRGLVNLTYNGIAIAAGGGCRQD